MSELPIQIKVEFPLLSFLWRRFIWRNEVACKQQAVEDAAVTRVPTAAALAGDGTEK